MKHVRTEARLIERGLILHLGAHLHTWTDAFLCYPFFVFLVAVLGHF